MIINARGRSALIVAAGLLALLASPVTAATDSEDSAPAPKSDSATVSTHRVLRHAWHRRHYVHHRSHRIATRPEDKEAGNKIATAEAAPKDATVAPSDKVLSNIPPSIANANAQMLLAGVQLTAAAAIPSGSDVPVAASEGPAKAPADSGTIVIAADQLNDVDRKLQEGSSAAVAPAASPATAAAIPASTETSPSPVPATVTMTTERSTWDQTSLIGKIFIGFGALLTMASAARMFIG